MLATLGGTLALAAGLLVLLIPLLVPELGRPRDAVWGALVLLLGLVLVTSAERLSGAPMLAVLCAGLLIGRLGTEVGQARWSQLSSEERSRFWSTERWTTGFSQLGAALVRAISVVGAGLGGLGAWLRQRREAAARQPAATKRWVRPDPAGDGAPNTAEEEPAPIPAEEPAAITDSGTEAESAQATPLATVRSFDEVDALLRQAVAAETSAAEAGVVTSEPKPEPKPEPEAEAPVAAELEAAVDPAAEPAGGETPADAPDALSEPDGGEGDPATRPGAGVDNSPLLPPQAP